MRDFNCVIGRGARSDVSLFRRVRPAAFIAMTVTHMNSVGPCVLPFVIITKFQKHVDLDNPGFTLRIRSEAFQ